MLKSLLTGFLIIFGVVFISVKIAAAQANETSAANEFYSSAYLRHDLKSSDVAAYVEVKEVKLAGRAGDADCENNTGNGYCSHLLTADVKQVFKGKIAAKTLEFFTGTEAGYPKKNLLGERIVFLVWEKNDQKQTPSLATIENSTRGAEAVEAMRRVVNPQSPINEADENEPYSRISIEKEFADADIVIFADVTSFTPKKEEATFERSVLQGIVKEVFKGKLKAGQKFTFEQDLLYRPIREEDLGAQVIFLTKKIIGGEPVYERGKLVYDRTNIAVSDIRHDVLEKLRAAAKKSKASLK